MTQRGPARPLPHPGAPRGPGSAESGRGAGPGPARTARSLGAPPAATPRGGGRPPSLGRRAAIWWRLRNDGRGRAQVRGGAGPAVSGRAGRGGAGTEPPRLLPALLSYLPYLLYLPAAAGAVPVPPLHVSAARGPFPGASGTAERSRRFHRGNGGEESWWKAGPSAAPSASRPQRLRKAEQEKRAFVLLMLGLRRGL